MVSSGTDLLLTENDFEILRARRFISVFTRCGGPERGAQNAARIEPKRLSGVLARRIASLRRDLKRFRRRFVFHLKSAKPAAILVSKSFSKEGEKIGGGLASPGRRRTPANACRHLTAPRHAGVFGKSTQR
jgi:hypothetical protein